MTREKIHGHWILPPWHIGLTFASPGIRGDLPRQISHGGCERLLKWLVLPIFFLPQLCINIYILYYIVRIFIHLFIHSFIHSFVRSFIHSFIHSINQVMSCRVVSCRVVSCRVVSFHFISFHFISFHFIRFIHFIHSFAIHLWDTKIIGTLTRSKEQFSLPGLDLSHICLSRRSAENLIGIKTQPWLVYRERDENKWNNFRCLLPNLPSTTRVMSSFQQHVQLFSRKKKYHTFHWAFFPFSQLPCHEVRIFSRLIRFWGQGWRSHLQGGWLMGSCPIQLNVTCGFYMNQIVRELLSKLGLGNQRNQNRIQRTFPVVRMICSQTCGSVTTTVWAFLDWTNPMS